MLKLSNISFSYDAAPTLQAISCAVKKGELVGIIGGNGCGKTTLLRIAAGLLTPSAGTRTLCGEVADLLPRKQLAQKLAYFPQTRPTPALTVEEYVSLGRYPHKSPLSPLSPRDRKAVEHALALTDTARFAARPVGSLSGGERQRVYLALLLAQEAKCLLLDEPTAHLDAGGAFALLALLRHLAAEGRAVLTVLHDLAPALTYCDRVLLMDAGKVVADLPPARLAESELLEQTLGVKALPVADGFAILPASCG